MSLISTGRPFHDLIPAYAMLCLEWVDIILGRLNKYALEALPSVISFLLIVDSGLLADFNPFHPELFFCRFSGHSLR